MKPNFSRWRRMNRLEIKLLLWSIVLIVLSVVALSCTDDINLKLLTIGGAFLIEMCASIRINHKHQVQPISNTYFLAYTVGFIGLTIADLICIIKMKESSDILYAMLISGALFIYVLGLMIMHQPDYEDTPPRYPPDNGFHGTHPRHKR